MKEDLDFGNIIRQRKERERLETEEFSKKKLLKNTNKKILTTGVGIIAVVEKNLGFLWGHEQKRELTTEERYIEEKFQTLRKEAFDNINKQIRNNEEEFKLYTIVCNGYSLQLPVYKEGP
jgi:transcription termination factor Rho